MPKMTVGYGMSEGHCNECVNNTLCKYIDEIEHIKLPRPFTVAFKCYAYKKEKP